MIDHKELMRQGEEIIAANLAECCREELEWQNTAVLCNGKMREAGKIYAQVDAAHALSIVQSEVARQAMQVIAAAPQVVADERKGSPYPDYDRGFSNGWDACAKRAAAPVQAQEQWIDKLTYDAQVDEWAIEKGNLELEIEALKSRTPVQPVAVPDGWRDKLVGLTVSMDVSTGDDDAFHRVFGEVESIMPEGDSHVILAVESSRNFAAPAAQGDAIRKVEVDDQGPLGVVTKTTYALANAKDAKDAERWREALQYVGADRSPALGCDYFVLRGIHVTPGSNLMRGSVAGHFTSAIDAAIAAKAAS